MTDGFRALIAYDGAFPVMVRLLQEAGLSTTDLWEGDSSYFAFGDNEAFGEIVLYPPAALIRSVIVSTDRRKMGLGTAMVAHLAKIAQRRGVRELWLLTTTAAPFFERCGFQQAERSEAPQQISATEQFRNLCPSTATLMRKRLS